MQHAKKMSDPPVCGFFSKLAEAYGEKKLRLVQGMSL